MLYRALNWLIPWLMKWGNCYGRHQAWWQKAIIWCSLPLVSLWVWLGSPAKKHGLVIRQPGSHYPNKWLMLKYLRAAHHNSWTQWFWLVLCVPPWIWRVRIEPKD